MLLRIRSTRACASYRSVDFRLSCYVGASSVLGVLRGLLCVTDGVSRRRAWGRLRDWGGIYVGRTCDFWDCYTSGRGSDTELSGGRYTPPHTSLRGQRPGLVNVLWAERKTASFNASRCGEWPRVSKRYRPAIPYPRKSGHRAAEAGVPGQRLPCCPPAREGHRTDLGSTESRLDGLGWRPFELTRDPLLPAASAGPRSAKLWG